MSPLLTILTVCPAELGSDYLKLYREALLRWNGQGLADTQVILLPQRPLDGLNLDPFEVVEVDHELVDGYPVWDVMRQIRAAWPSVRGEYITVDHPEFIWGPGRLEKTIAWLRGYRPIYALGNLRRDGNIEELTSQKAREDSREPSRWFKGFLDEGRWDDAIPLFEFMSTMHWMYWFGPPQRPGTNDWVEDVFYIDKEWLDVWKFADYPGEMPFQDVWDLLQVSIKMQALYSLPFECVRMPMDINKIRHLWHPRLRSNFTPAMRDWFLSQPDRWARSAFSDPELWRGLIALARNPGGNNLALSRLRYGYRGTAANYRIAVSQWLDSGGVETLRAYYQERRERALR